MLRATELACAELFSLLHERGERPITIGRATAVLAGRRQARGPRTGAGGSLIPRRDRDRIGVGDGRRLSSPAGVVSGDGRNTSAILEVVLSSSRRVKKGPGRRPQSAKRRRFVELRERGLSIDVAAHEVGVSRTEGRNWAKGYKTYGSGQVVGFVPALDRLEVREISAQFLSQDERFEIADLEVPRSDGRGWCGDYAAWAVS
jgi:hypothetical protein